MIILVTGLTGAGKTTYCKNRSANNLCKIYSIDSWMKDLYWQDMPEAPDMNWFVENQKWYTDRIKRCEQLIAKEVQELSRSNIEILLDLGFTSVEHRKKFINLATDSGQEVQIHHVDVDSSTRWQRVVERNEMNSETYVMKVTKEMFDYIEDIFESFTDDEKKILTAVKN